MDYVHKNNLSAEEIQLLAFDYNNRKKTTATAYTLLVFFGPLFLHRFYLGPTPYAIFGAVYTLVLNLAILGFVFVGLANGQLLDYALFLTEHIYIVAIVWIPYIWLLLDIFRIPALVDHVNHQTERAILAAMSQGK